MKYIIAFLILSGCAPVPLVGAPGSQPPALYAIMLPLCLFGCNNPVTTVREDIVSGGEGSLTTGGRTVSTTTSTSRSSP